MFREKMDLRIKTMLLPFTELSFYWQDSINDLARGHSTIEYRNCLEKQVLPAVYPILNKTNRIYNLDEIKLLIRKFFPHEELQQLSCSGRFMSRFYFRYLAKLSQFLLTHRNGKVALKYWESEREADLLGPYKGSNKVALWSSMNRMFTTDILVVLYLLQNGMGEEQYLKSYHGSVNLADTQLEQILSKGVAETHLHLSAGENFNMNWQRLMSPESNHYDPTLDWLFGDEVMRKEGKLQKYVRAMAIIRILLAHHLSTSERRSQDERVLTLFHHYQQDSAKVASLSPIDILMRVYHGKRLEHSELDFDGMYQSLLIRYRLAPQDSCREEDWKRALAKQDVIHRLTNPSGEDGTVELVFLMKCMRYMMSSEPDDFFNQIFWQYLRVKNEIFQLHIQANSTRGLENFVSYFERATKQADVELSLHQQMENPYLRKLEVRIAPGGRDSDERNIKQAFAKKLKTLLKAYQENICSLYNRGQMIPEIGIVVHFIKKEDEHDIEKCWLDANPFTRQFGETDLHVDSAKLYFRNLQEKYMAEMRVVRDLREEIPGLSDYIVGIDAAGVEFATEPWVFAPVFREARNSDTHRSLHPSAPDKRVRNLGLTYHAGEDFRHLMTGVRRVHEVVQHFQFHAGDRIGHGIALGINPNLWMQRNQVVMLPRIEHLENLLWIWGLYKDGVAKEVDSTNLQQEILTLAKEIYVQMEGITVFSLWEAYQSKFRTFEMSNSLPGKREASRDTSRLFCHYINTNNIWTAERLTFAQHCKCYLHKMVEPIQVEVRREDLKMLKELQTLIRQKVSREGIVIETNPSSNTAIGEVENIFQHYILTLNQRGFQEQRNVEDGVMVTINSDDPIVFNTNINNEIAYLFYSLLEKGHAREDVLSWVDKVREIGVYSSFIESRGIPFQQRMEEISEILIQLESYC
ncbi:hypothetical protein CIG75_02635 [Tumebacillus algifaecis]|uniref:Adenosine deaminase domain-containing protein n=1 Tax=Tumebacillus algifaecis TaxID=1214604 RepID=A0A223CXF1_9BACL|nr:hypothetical protein [Tumebacillus algifaecis]ASS73986.1 hypothetical protein CIG75_02635 [Tumebacillus algifaecis]